MASSLLAANLSVVNIGVDTFNQSIEEAGGSVLQVDWQPPGNADPRMAWLLAQLTGDPSNPDSLGSRIDRANQQAVERIVSSQTMLVDVALHARELWPQLEAGGGRTLMHAGAPVAWPDMCGPMHGAMIGAALYEGWAQTADEARRMLERGDIKLTQCHDFGAVGPMTGIITASMPVLVVRNTTHGNLAYTNINEGIGKVLRFGANSPEVIARLKWFEQVLAPAMKRALKAGGGIDLKSIQSQALLMGDEVHSRNAASTALFFMQLAVSLAKSDVDRVVQHAVLRFIADTSQFFLNLSMVSAKAIMDSARDIEYSSVVTCMARNGTTTAARISTLGERWFQAPSAMPVGLFFPGFKQTDACPDLGDSAITETAGFGGFSFAASPALTLLAGGSVSEAVAYSRLMYHITSGSNPGSSLPALDFAAGPVGIDIRKVVDTGIQPVVTTGIAHRDAGVGQIGAGVVRPPMAIFVQALEALADKYLAND
jgi:Protein of unknown function (DUF1116)